MGLFIRNTLAVLPAGDGHAAGRHDVYIEDGEIAGIDEERVRFEVARICERLGLTRA